MKEYDLFLTETRIKTAADDELRRMVYHHNILRKKILRELSDRETKRKDASCIDKIGDQAWIFEFDELCNHTTNVFPNRKLTCDCNYMTVEQAETAILERYPTAQIAYSEIQPYGEVTVLFAVTE